MKMCKHQSAVVEASSSSAPSHNGKSRGSSNKKRNNKHNNQNRRGQQELLATPTQKDVLFGRGRHILKHSGNTSFLNLVKCHRPRYQRVRTSRVEKLQIVTKIIQTVQDEYKGKFLKKKKKNCNKEEEEAQQQGEQQEQQWVVATQKEIMQKVAHCLREKSLTTAPGNSVVVSSSTTMLKGETTTVRPATTTSSTTTTNATTSETESCLSTSSRSSTPSSIDNDNDDWNVNNVDNTGAATTVVLLNSSPPSATIPVLPPSTKTISDVRSAAARKSSSDMGVNNDMITGMMESPSPVVSGLLSNSIVTCAEQFWRQQNHQPQERPPQMRCPQFGIPRCVSQTSSCTTSSTATSATTEIYQGLQRQQDQDQPHNLEIPTWKTATATNPTIDFDTAQLLLQALVDDPDDDLSNSCIHRHDNDKDSSIPPWEDVLENAMSWDTTAAKASVEVLNTECLNTIF